MPPTRLVIHHSHTDPGDTDPQAVVEPPSDRDLARDPRAVRMRT
jgi:hypothetical protein